MMQCRDIDDLMVDYLYQELDAARMAEQVPPLLEVVDHYRTAGVLTTVDGRTGIDSVSANLAGVLDALSDTAKPV